MENNTNLVKKAYSDKIQIQSQNDFIIPENIFDIDSVLVSKCEVSSYDYDIRDGGMYIKCNLIYDLLLMCEDASISGVTYTDETEHFISIPNTKNDPIIDIGQMTCNSQSKLINPRKVNISSVISFPLDTYALISAQTEVSGVEALEDEISLYRHKNTYTCIDTTFVRDEKIPVSYDINLDANNPPISKILYRTLRLTPYEIKARDNTVEVKVYACISVIYLSEEGNRFSLDKTFILERSISAENADTYEWSMCVYSNNLSTVCAENSYGEKKLIEVDFDYDILLRGNRNVEINCCDDIYSSKYQSICEMTETEVTRKLRTYSSSLSVNASVEREKVNADDIKTVLMAQVNITDTSKPEKTEKNRLSCQSMASITLVCERTSLGDEDKKYSSYTFEYPIKCTLDTTELNDNEEYETEITVTDIRYRADSNKLYCDFEAQIYVNGYTDTEAKLVKTASLDKNKEITPPVSSVILCYPLKDESLWDIAKKYSVSPDMIAKNNGIENGEIADKRVLMISFNE